MGVPYHLEENPPKVAETWLESGMEEKARRWRRQRSAEVLRSLLSGVSSDADANADADADADVVATGFVVTAHHADDQLETILMKLVRGVHLSQIQGMETCTAPNEHAAITLRPLLGSGVGGSGGASRGKNGVNAGGGGNVGGNESGEPITRAELEAFMSVESWPWCEDPSNQSDQYKRNKVRRQVSSA